MTLHAFFQATNVETDNIEILATQLMTQFGLIEEGWKFLMVDRRRPLGYCNHLKKEIAVSAQYAMYNSEVEVKDTLLHEIAHALVGSGHGHRKVWKEKCIEVGAKPEQYASDVKMPKGKYTGSCPECKVETQFYSKIKRAKACSRCCNANNDGKYTEKYKLEIIQNY